MLRYDVVDVFTDRPFSGNQLAVVHGAEDLEDEQLLALAREFGYSETTFPSDVSADGYHVRIFTPGGEIPFAGHPTLGTAWVLRESFGSADVVQRCGAGDIAVTIGDRTALTALPGDLAVAPETVVLDVLDDLGLGPGDLAGTGYLAGTGLTFLYVPVVADAVARARVATRTPAYDGMRDPFGGIEVYAVDGTDVHVRMFSPGLAVAEDAATGSAAAGLGLVLAASGVLPDGGAYVVSQGAEIGRPSTLYGEVVATERVASRVVVAGEVQPIASGSIRVP